MARPRRPPEGTWKGAGCGPCPPRWTGEPLKRKRLLVTAEQGTATSLAFASVFADLTGRAMRDGGSVTP
jgi:hypothetical protein